MVVKLLQLYNYSSVSVGLMFPYLLLELGHFNFKSICFFPPLPPACLGILELTVEPCQLGLVSFLD